MHNFKNIKSIIWDWNGTLLNDVEISIMSMNQMLEKRNYPLLSREKYLAIFTFPVQEYYKNAGVDFDVYDWDTIAMEFISNYRKNVKKAKLHKDVQSTLDHFERKNISQYILSAMEQGFLNETVSTAGIDGMFKKIVGLNNHYAATKEGIAGELVREIDLKSNEICMIGDTIHDLEVAEVVGVPCVLISHGHQSHARLKNTGAVVVKDFQELRELFGEAGSQVSGVR
jgi:phosphoglycolate phosphatase